MKQLHLSEACISHSWAPGLGEGPKGPSVNIWSSYQRPSSSSILFDLLSSCLTSLHHLTLPCAPSPKRSHQGDEGRRSRQGHLLFWPRKYWSLVTRQSIRPRSLGSLSLSRSLSVFGSTSEQLYIDRFSPPTHRTMHVLWLYKGWWRSFIEPYLHPVRSSDFRSFYCVHVPSFTSCFIPVRPPRVLLFGLWVSKESSSQQLAFTWLYCGLLCNI